MSRVSRREFLARSAAAGGYAALLASCSRSLPPALVEQAQQATTPFAFTVAQRSALEAAVAQLIPAQGTDDWSAADVGAVEYIEQLLNAFSGGGNPKLYGGGPSRAFFARFQRLPRAKQVGWMAGIARLRAIYADGLDRINRLAAGGDFPALPAPAQVLLLEAEDLQNTPFFATLFAHTMEGVYAHPVYGGNRDYAGWRLAGYQGDVHGVRFPGGHDPIADHAPWRKYGGYTPEEIGQPGTGEGPTT